jgi:hypothetical protein
MLGVVDKRNPCTRVGVLWGRIIRPETVLTKERTIEVIASCRRLRPAPVSKSATIKRLIWTSGPPKKKKSVKAQLRILFTNLDI